MRSHPIDRHPVDGIHVADERREHGGLVAAAPLVPLARPERGLDLPDTRRERGHVGIVQPHEPGKDDDPPTGGLFERARDRIAHAPALESGSLRDEPDCRLRPPRRGTPRGPTRRTQQRAAAREGP
jgi:hypothetical protein